LADNPTGEQDLSLGAEVDPATWRKIELRASKRDGSWAEVVLLRPVSWLEDRGARVGGTLEIAVPECGIDGRAEVLSITPCPPIKRGTGRVVTGTLKHTAANTINVYVEGEAEPIGVTANHLFWSADRRDFIRAEELHSGEALRTQTGTTKVVALRPSPLTRPVYNLEVELVHTYHVSASGILGHNGGAVPSCVPAKFRAEYQAIPDATWNQSRNGMSLKERYLEEIAEKGANARSPQQFVDSHLTRWANADDGPAFENAAKQAMGAPTGPGSKPTKTGNSRPDLYDGRTYEVPLETGGTLKLEGATEIKGWDHLKDKKTKYNTYQLSEIAEAARENGDKFNLVISPDTKKIAGNVVDLVRNRKGKIVQFNPESGKFTEIDYSGVEPGEPWKRNTSGSK
jgi:hypothetical protein